MVVALLLWIAPPASGNCFHHGVQTPSCCTALLLADERQLLYPPIHHRRRDFHTAMVATVPRETPQRAPPCEKPDSPYDIKFVFVQKITFVLRKIRKNCRHHSCTF